MILGIIVILIAIILYVITMNVSNKGSNIGKPEVTSSMTTTTSRDNKEDESRVVTEGTSNIVTSSASEPSISSTTSIVTEATSTNSSKITASVTEKVEAAEPIEEEQVAPILLEIDEATMPEGIVKTEVAVVAKRAICLVDNELYYVVTLLLPDNTKINYFASKGGYDVLISGMQVKIEYVVYKTKNGNTYSIVNNVSLIN